MERGPKTSPYRKISEQGAEYEKKQNGKKENWNRVVQYGLWFGSLIYVVCTVLEELAFDGNLSEAEKCSGLFEFCYDDILLCVVAMMWNRFAKWRIVKMENVTLSPETA